MKLWRRPLLLAGILLCLSAAFAQPQSDAPDNVAAPREILVADLPPEARATLQLVRQGGPFPNARDGVVFGNREHKLPKQPRGYYREYTVKTPGVHGRGARRIVCGPLAECYYSGNHYRTFRRIVGGQRDG